MAKDFFQEIWIKVESIEIKAREREKERNSSWLRKYLILLNKTDLSSSRLFPVQVILDSLPDLTLYRLAPNPLRSFCRLYIRAATQQLFPRPVSEKDELVTRRSTLAHSDSLSLFWEGEKQINK